MKPPAFQFYPKDFLEGSTALSNAACGAYMRLLCHAWNQTPLGSLPDDDYTLFKFSGADSQTEWDSYKAQVLGKFKYVASEKKYYNQRLVAERLKQKNFSESQSERAKAGWNKRKKGDA